MNVSRFFTSSAASSGDRLLGVVPISPVQPSVRSRAEMAITENSTPREAPARLAAKTMKSTLALLAALLLAPLAALHAADGDLALNYHLMHPGGDSSPGDPNAAFYLDGTYHLHYILAHPWKEKKSFSFVHVTSPA